MSEQQGLGAAPPLSAITYNDQAGTLWIVTILATIYVVLSALVRAFVKWGIYGPDDYLLAIATVRCQNHHLQIMRRLCFCTVCLYRPVRRHLPRSQPRPLQVQLHHHQGPMGGCWPVICRV
jgi:hypothetical protein